MISSAIGRFSLLSVTGLSLMQTGHRIPSNGPATHGERRGRAASSRPLLIHATDPNWHARAMQTPRKGGRVTMYGHHCHPPLPIARRGPNDRLGEFWLRGLTRCNRAHHDRQWITVRREQEAETIPSTARPSLRSVNLIPGLLQARSASIRRNGSRGARSCGSRKRRRAFDCLCDRSIINFLAGNIRDGAPTGPICQQNTSLLS
jgi:hypothetical protein